MNWSHRQQDIFNAYRDTDQNICITAGPGCGKTTVLKEGIRIAEKEKKICAYLAFNKGLKDEMDITIKQNKFKRTKAFTVHSLGINLLKGFSNNLNYYYLKGNRINSLMFNRTKYIMDMNKTFISSVGWKNSWAIRKTLWELDILSKQFYSDDLEFLYAQAVRMNKNLYKGDITPLWKDWLSYRKDLIKDYVNGKSYDLTFLDMLYLPVKLNLDVDTKDIRPNFSKVQRLFLDEGQDFSKIAFMLIEKIFPTMEKFMAVYDNKQMIMGFAGALSGGTKRLINVKNTIELPLDICYRLPLSGITNVNKVYPDSIVPAPNAIEGSIYDIEDVKDIPLGSLVLSRTNAYLIDVYFRLKRLGRDTILLGDEITAQIKAIIKKLGNTKSIKKALEDGEVELQTLKLRQEQSKNEQDRISYFMFKNQFKALNTFIKCLNLDPNIILSNVIKHLDLPKEVTSDTIQIMSCHKSKGREADNVVMIREHDIPSEYALGNEEAERQETNLLFVARSRHKKNYIHLNFEL